MFNMILLAILAIVISAALVAIAIIFCTPAFDKWHKERSVKRIAAKLLAHQSAKSKQKDRRSLKLKYIQWKLAKAKGFSEQKKLDHVASSNLWRWELKQRSLCDKLKLAIVAFEGSTFEYPFLIGASNNEYGDPGLVTIYSVMSVKPGETNVELCTLSDLHVLFIKENVHLMKYQDLELFYEYLGGKALSSSENLEQKRINKESISRAEIAEYKEKAISALALNECLEEVALAKRRYFLYMSQYNDFNEDEDL